MFGVQRVVPKTEVGCFVYLCRLCDVLAASHKALSPLWPPRCVLGRLRFEEDHLLLLADAAGQLSPAERSAAALQLVRFGRAMSHLLENSFGNFYSHVRFLTLLLVLGTGKSVMAVVVPSGWWTSSRHLKER